MKLEDFPKVKFYVEQPETIKYIHNNKVYIYTPDFAVFLESNEVFFVEIKNFTGMVDARVHRSLEAFIDFCSNLGFGLLLLNSNGTIKHVFDHEFNPLFRDELKSKLNENGGRTIFFEEFKAIQETYKAHWIEFLSIVLNENWSLYPFPFKLSNRNSYPKFRETFIR